MKETKPLSKAVATLPGYIIGVLWLAMAISAIWSSASGYANGRSGWGLGWGLVGFFLLAAALAALVGTWWHNHRVSREG
jgi:sterol desaturase/sphingolipid hydroxylase (fatty acid hydroxylase superfamily)